MTKDREGPTPAPSRPASARWLAPVLDMVAFADDMGVGPFLKAVGGLTRLAWLQAPFFEPSGAACEAYAAKRRIRATDHGGTS